MLVKRYIALSHTCCKTDGGLEISVHFCVDKKTKRTQFFYQIHDFKSISSFVILDLAQYTWIKYFCIIYDV